VKGKEESVSKAREEGPAKPKEQIKPVSGIAQIGDSDRLHRKG